MHKSRPLPKCTFTYTARLTGLPSERTETSPWDHMTLADHEKLAESIVGTSMTAWHGVQKKTAVRLHGDKSNFCQSQCDPNEKTSLDKDFRQYQNGRVYRLNKLHFEQAPDPIGKVTRAWLDKFGCVMIEFQLDSNRLSLHQAALIAKGLKSDVSLSVAITKTTADPSDPSCKPQYTFEPLHVALTDFGRYPGTHIISGRCEGVADAFNFDQRDPARKHTHVLSRGWDSKTKLAASQAAKTKTKEENILESPQPLLGNRTSSPSAASMATPTENTPTAPPAAVPGEPTDELPEQLKFLENPDQDQRELQLMELAAKQAEELKAKNKELEQFRSREQMKKAHEADTAKMLVETTLGDEDLIAIASSAMGVPEEELKTKSAAFVKFLDENKAFEQFPEALQLVTVASRHHRDQVEQLMQQSAQDTTEPQRQAAIAAMRQAFRSDPSPKPAVPGAVSGVASNSRRVPLPSNRVNQPVPSAPAPSGPSVEELKRQQVDALRAWYS